MLQVAIHHNSVLISTHKHNAQETLADMYFSLSHNEMHLVFS